MNRGYRSLAFPLALLVLVAESAPGCRQRMFVPVADAAADGAGTDGPLTLTLDIAVTGCLAYDGGAARCSGAAPLVLSFSPVGSPEISGFKWTFGDGTPPALERAPSHTYPLPGDYDVTLIGMAGMSGFIQSRTPVHIAVDPRAAGAPCDVEAQCAPGLSCACARGTGCPAAFTRGLCSTACDTAPCGPAAACAALALGPLPDAGPTPRLPYCVAVCQADADCAPGFVCQILPAAGTSEPEAWIRGCLPLGALADLGAPCRNANGDLDDGTCATGACADLGALGTCSSTCDGSRPCPESATCARLDDGRQLCLLACGAGAASCTRDPLLACGGPNDGDGGAGFQSDAAAGTTYCAPKPCTSDADCAPSGRCGTSSRCARL